MGVVVRRYIDILIIIITFSYSTCVSSFFDSSIPTSLFIFTMFFRSCFNSSAHNCRHVVYGSNAMTTIRVLLLDPFRDEHERVLDITIEINVLKTFHCLNQKTVTECCRVFYRSRQKNISWLCAQTMQSNEPK